MSPSRTISVTDGDLWLAGDLDVPTAAFGLVVFAHGSGSSRHSPRNQHVAGRLRERGLATLLLDLLTLDEEAADARTGKLRFDVGLLARRLGTAVAWARTDPATASLPLGLFGASTGAAAALLAAAAAPDAVRAVVSRGGRADLAGDQLAQVRAPTLLLVGERDEVVLGLNERAGVALGGPWQLVVVPGAAHLFEEPGALDAVADRAGEWFVEHLGPTGST